MILVWLLSDVIPASVAVGSIGNTAIRPFFWLKP